MSENIPPVETIRSERHGSIYIVTIDRPTVRNAVDGSTAAVLARAFRSFDADPELAAAVLTGAGNTFGVTRMLLSKPVIAAVEGYAVAGGLELALWCDLRVAAENAIFGVYNRRWGVPLVDGGTIRLSRQIGHSHALDLILTGRSVSGEEARTLGLANRLVPRGEALKAAIALATDLARFPQQALRNDRLSSYTQWSHSLEDALREETRLGQEVMRSGEATAGARRFVSGHGRHGAMDDI